MATLDAEAARLFTGRNWGVIGTIRPDGTPHLTPVWVDWDGEHVLVNSAHGRAKVRHLRRDPRVAVEVFDHEQPQRAYVSVTGTAELVDEGADEHIDRLARRYLGVDEYPYRTPGMRRVIIRVTPERVNAFVRSAT